MSRNGTQMNWQGAFAPGMKGGRRAHPPKAERIFDKKLNIKERRKAIRSALAASVDKTVVTQRGHKIPTNFPFIIDSAMESIAKTQDVIEALLKLSLGAELERASVKKIRSGIGKTRGRPYQTRKGPLIVVSKDCPLKKAAGNIAGVDVVEVNRLNAALLAPGTHAGRLTLYTEAAIERMEKEGLFK
jgi:large subunit ribosomal protein L4e